MNDSILNGLLIFGIIQAFLFAGLFMSKKNRTSADLVMMFWLLLFSVHSFLILVNLNNTYSKLFQAIPKSLTLLYGPFLFVYVGILGSKPKHTRRLYLWHFIPFVVYLTLTFLFFESSIFRAVLALSGAVSGLLYCLVTLYSLRKHNEQIVELFSSIEEINLSWVRKLVKVIVLIWIGVFILVVGNQIFQIRLSLHWFFIGIPLFIAYIGYYGLQQQVIFHVAQEEESKVTEKDPEVKINKGNTLETDESYRKSGLQENDMEVIFHSLESVMQRDKLFLHQNLSLPELADKVKIPRHHITQTLNSYARQSFYDYVNTYRINAFIDRLKNGDTDNFSLLGIAFDCGFNSKSSFNRIFKTATGKSPSEYKKHIS